MASMLEAFFSAWLHWWSGPPCFRIYGKGRREAACREIDVYATRRRDADSCWRLWRGTCITYSSDVIVVGGDFAREVLHDHAEVPATRKNTMTVADGRLNDLWRRSDAGRPELRSA